MTMSLWLWMIHRNWQIVSAPPKVTRSPAPRRSNTGFTSTRAASVSPIARVANIAIGA